MDTNDEMIPSKEKLANAVSYKGCNFASLESPNFAAKLP